MSGRMHSRNRAARLVVLAAAVCMVAGSSRASAEVVWNWAFGGTEAGTFTTTGSFADTAGSFDFEITGFTVTASVVPDLVGRPSFQNQAPQGFLWDGDSPTQFYRDGGTYTNGSNLFVLTVSERTYQFLFYAADTLANGGLNDPEEAPVVPLSALTLTPSPVPEPSTYAMALAGLACGGYSILRRRKRA